MNRYWIVVLIVVVAVFLWSRRGENAGSISQRQNVPPPGGWTDADIDVALRSGNKIEAIKMYRMVHKVGLKDAKDAVDARERELSNPG